MTEKKKLYAYCRVSTKKQADAGTLKNQVRSIKKFLDYQQDKFEIIEWFKEDVSAFKERPEFNKLRDKVISSKVNINIKVDGVIISKLDRIGRSVKQLVNFIDLLNKMDIDFIVTEQNINTSTKEGKLMFHIISSIAEYEAGLIRERMQEGIERYLEEGGKLGRKEIEISKDLKKKMITWYNKGFGFKIIKKLLEIEDPPLKLSIKTVGNKLHGWDVNIRSPNHRAKKDVLDDINE